MGGSVLPAVSSARGPTTGLCEQEAAPGPEPGVFVPTALLLWTHFLQTPEFPEVFRPAVVACGAQPRRCHLPCARQVGHRRCHRPAVSLPRPCHPQLLGAHGTNTFRRQGTAEQPSVPPFAPAPRAPSASSHLPRFPSGLPAREEK